MLCKCLPELDWSFFSDSLLVITVYFSPELNAATEKLMACVHKHIPLRDP